MTRAVSYGRQPFSFLCKSIFVFDFAVILLAKKATFAKSQLFRHVFVPLFKAKS